MIRDQGVEQSWYVVSKDFPNGGRGYAHMSEATWVLMDKQKWRVEAGPFPDPKEAEKIATGMAAINHVMES